MSDRVIRGVAAGGQVLAFAAVTTDMVEEARLRHGLSPVMSAALGRTMTAAAMMGLQLKSAEEEISIQIKGNGPAGGVYAVCNGEGHVRGYVDVPRVDLPLNAKGKLDVARAIGIGVLSIVKDLGLKEPYVGSTHLVTSEIAEDLAYYFTVSEQVPSAVALGVLVHPDESIWTSGGYMIQLLPGASDEVAELLQQRCQAFPQLTTYLAQDHTPEEVLSTLLDGMDFELLQTLPVSFKCNCDKDRVERALISIGAKDLQSLIDENEPVEMTCHYCNRKYNFTIDEVKELLKKAKA
ncbi:MAG: Hsp33 family molecular chaperone HslO [Firmicutes bacterium]|nr:Hsp33 family molecular chaperone HslO [Bacillota bacterium]